MAVEERRGSARGGWEAVREALREYRVTVELGGEELSLGFVDREGEAGALYEARMPRVSVLVGPRGCGKSELVRALLHALSEAQGGEPVFLRLYWRKVQRGEEDVVETVVEASEPQVARAIRSAAEALGGAGASLEVAAGAGGVPSVTLTGVRLGAATLLGRLAGRLTEILGRRRVVALVDEVKVKANRVHDVASDLDVIHDMMVDLYRRTGLDAAIVYLTSDSTAARLAARVGDKVDFLLMWNLPREPFQELYRQLGEQLGPPKGLDFEFVWQLTGGNPRHLLLLAEEGWRPEAYLERHIIEPLVSVLLGYAKRRLGSAGRAPELLKGEAQVYVEKVGLDMTHLYDELEERNIVMPLRSRTRRLTELPQDEPWTGEWWAYQIPAYYWALKAMVERGRLRVEPREVLEEVRRHIRR